MLVGYVRVSTRDQNLDLQLEALNAAGCTKIFSDKLSGTRGDRPGSWQAIDYMRHGDSLVVWKLDRLGRSVKQLVDLAADLERLGKNLKSLTDGIDTGTPAGRFFFHVMASLAEMERDLIIERTVAGLAAAKRAGRVGGRHRVMTKLKLESARRLIESGIATKDVAEQLGVSIPTLYRHLPGKRLVHPD